MHEQKQARRYFVSGRVQGVGYRYFATGAAERQGIRGYTRNLPDGRVEVYALGTDAQLQAFAAELRRGPRMARVEHVSEIAAETLTEYDGRFFIERA